jgi:hypothetical protein
MHPIHERAERRDMHLGIITRATIVGFRRLRALMAGKGVLSVGSLVQLMQMTWLVQGVCSLNSLLNTHPRISTTLMNLLLCTGTHHSDAESISFYRQHIARKHCSASK